MSSSTTLVVGLLMLMIGFSAFRRGIVGDGGGDCAVVASAVLLLV